MKVSIITINYNNCEGLRRTIESVINQTCHDFEYIIIDGGSTDGSLEVIKEYSSYINYWCSECDNGIYDAMNKGIDRARGEYCQFLNSGDSFHCADVLEQVVPFLDGIDIVVGQLFFSNTLSASEVVPSVSMLRLYNRSLPHSSAYISTHLLKKYHYDTSLRIVSDWKFYIQSLIFNNASYKFIEVVVSDFDTTGISSQNTALVQKERMQVLNELLPERILADYFTFSNGIGYKECLYDQLFIQTRKFPQYARIVYFISVSLLKFISLFKKGAQYVSNFPIMPSKLDLFNHK